MNRTNKRYVVRLEAEERPMTRAQRNVLVAACAFVAAATHFYVGDWHESNTGLLGKVFGYDYGPGAPLVGFLRYQGGEGFGAHYTDHRGLAVFLLGVVFPVALLTMAGFLYFAGPPKARPVVKG